MRGYDVHWRLDCWRCQVSNSGKLLLPVSSSMHSWKRSCTYTSAQSSVLLSNSLLTDLKDKAYSNLTILPALKHRGSITTLIAFLLKILFPAVESHFTRTHVSAGSYYGRKQRGAFQDLMVPGHYVLSEWRMDRLWTLKETKVVSLWG